jgi:hypothetical protein
MFSHGLLAGMMFLLVGVMYDQVHHRDMNRFGGLATSLPKYTFIAMIGFFGSLGLPGLSGFIAEMMVFFGSFQSKLAHAETFTIVATAGIVLGAVYILVMIQKVFLGKPLARLEFGGAAGSNVAYASSYQMQRSFDMAYMQCMYARGNQVPGQAVARRQPVFSYPPPNYPAPAAAPQGYPPGNYPPPNTPPPAGVAPQG